jgi:hypothetical protein
MQSMKKHLTFVLAIVFSFNSAIGEIPVITMKTSMAIGSTFSFSLFCDSANKKIQVDFGDGNLITKTIYYYGDGDTIISGTLIGSHTVKIYSADIVHLDCSFNQLTSIDISSNNTLHDLNCSNNLLDSLDISKNTKLENLVCSYNKLTALDVSKNTALQDLWCDSNKLVIIDVSKNTNLASLFCSFNFLTALDIKSNVALVSLYCSNNKLTSLDVSKNESLNEFSCSNNHLAFSTLPLEQNYWTAYNYAPQNSILIAKSLNLGVELDLSNQNTFAGHTTIYTWKTQSGTTLILGTDYIITNGKTIFLKAPSDSIYCELTNDIFPDFSGSEVLKTTYIKVLLNSAVSQLKPNRFDIYSRNKTLFVNLTNNAKISVFDAIGRIIVSKPANIGTCIIQMQNRGVYLVKLSGTNGTVTRKIFIE